MEESGNNMFHIFYSARLAEHDFGKEVGAEQVKSALGQA